MAFAGNAIPMRTDEAVVLRYGIVALLPLVLVLRPGTVLKIARPAV
jgi:hypothetical protein